MDEPKASRRERIVIGFLFFGCCLLGVSGVASSPLDVRGSGVPPDVQLARVVLVVALLTMAAAVAYSFIYWGSKDGLRLMLSKAWPTLLFGAGAGFIVGFFLRALFRPPILWIVLVVCGAAAVCFILRFARKRPPEEP
jgi:hypothetical protein